MKGFIEVTNGESIFCININKISSFGNKCILIYGMSFETNVEQSYQEIKELIKKAK